MGAILSEPVTAMVVDRATTECWTCASCTMQGWRRTHEDAHIFAFSSGGVEDSGVFAVLDGHGGSAAAHQGAAILKEKLVDLARRGALPNSAAERELEEVFIGADQQLRSQLPADERSGSTVVAAIITRSPSLEYCVQLAHCGDSRAVLCSQGRLFCSEDHKPGREDETRRIVAAGGTVAHGALGGGPLRVDGALAVSRAIGDFQFKPASMEPKLCKVTALPEVQTITRVSAGDWLLLACDGIFDVFSNEEIQEFISPRIAAAAPDPVDGGIVMAELLQACLDKGSKDNCTACLVQLHTGRTPRPHSRELLQGRWASAAPDVKQKYEDFCMMEGFEEEARAMKTDPGAEVPLRRASSNSSGASGPAPVQPTASGSGGGGGGQSSNPKIVAITKALAAMRSSRTIQGAWRNSRSGSGLSGSDAGESPSNTETANAGISDGAPAAGTNDGAVDGGSAASSTRNAPTSNTSTSL